MLSVIYYIDLNIASIFSMVAAVMATVVAEVAVEVGCGHVMVFVEA